MESLVKTARIESGLSIEEAASQLGIPAGYLSQIENGLRGVDPLRAEKISKLYQREKEQIFLPSRYAIREVPIDKPKEVG